MSQKVVENLEQAKGILADTIEAEWGQAIKHPEPQIIVACAIVVNHFGATVEALGERVEELSDLVNRVLDRID